MTMSRVHTSDYQSSSYKKNPNPNPNPKPKPKPNTINNF